MSPVPSAEANASASRPPRQLHLPVLMLSQYLFFLTRRPISKSNFSYLESRLRGLKSLREALSGENVPGLAEVIRQLETLSPAGFNRVGTNLQFALLPLAQTARFLPEDLVVEDGIPVPDWLKHHRRVLLVLAPGIGIGDELILFPLPKWLKQANPALEITTLSGYSELWDRVRHVDKALVYRDYRPILSALRGEAPHEGYDLVILADFEAPELYRGVASDGRVPAYLEISLGSRSAFLVDNRRRWIHRVHHLTPYAENYYFGLNQVLRRLGLHPRDGDRFDAVTTRVDRRPADRLQLFISPFTSKYDPSHAYWSHLLAEIGSGKHPRPIRMMVDSGKNLSTESFAVALARSVRARVAPDVEVQVAYSGAGKSLSLSGVFEQLESAHAVVCADSFASHAAPLFQCNSLVVMRAGVENWRVPSDGSFFFDGNAPAGEVGAAMRKVLLALETPLTATERLARFTQAEVRSEQLARELEALFDGDLGRSVDQLYRTYEEFVDLNQALVEARDSGANEGAGLFCDTLASAPLRRPSASAPQQAGEALLLHLRDQFERWRNTNYVKALRLQLGAQAPSRAGGSR